MKKSFPYPNLTLFFLIIFILVSFSESPVVLAGIKFIGSLGHIGIFLTGIFFVSSFTAAPATLLLIKLSSTYGVLETAVVGALGTMVGDYVLFRFFRDKLFDEIKSIFEKYKIKGISKKESKFYKTIIQPILGAIIIASPFPDEIGVAMLGFSNIKKWHFLILAFVLNCIGIYILISLF